MTASPQMKDSVLEQAQDWVVLLHSGHVTEADKEAFRAWLKSDPEHSAIYAREEQFWRDLSMTEAFVPQEDYMSVSGQAPSQAQQVNIVPLTRRRPAAIWAIAAMLLLVIGAGYMRWWQPDNGMQSFSTGLGEVQEIALSDGSRVFLGASSNMAVSIGKNSREVELLAGQAYFDVQKNDAAPFSVVSGSFQTTVLGTAFEVTTGAYARVAVVEGMVKVQSLATKESGQKLLEAGYQVEADSTGTLSDIKPVQGAMPGGWRNGRLSYEDVSLGELTADINRYYGPGVIIGDEVLNSLRVNASFPPNQVKQMLSALASSHSMSASFLDDGKIVLRADDPK